MHTTHQTAEAEARQTVRAAQRAGRAFDAGYRARFHQGYADDASLPTTTQMHHALLAQAFGKLA